MSYIALLLFLFFNIIRPQDWSPIFYGAPVINILISMILLGVIFFPRKHNLEVKHVCTTFIASFLGIVFLSSFINVDMGYAFGKSIVVFKLVIFFLIPLLIITEARRASFTLKYIVCLVLFVGLEIISVAWGGEGVAGQVRLQGSYYAKEIRIPWVGIWDGPNVVAVLLLLAFSICLVYFGSARNALGKLILLGCMSCLLLAIYYTGSRGAILTAPVVVAVYLVLMKQTKWLVILILLTAFFAYFIYKPERELSSTESSAHERVLLWEKGLIDLRYKGPLLGIGYGQFINNGFKLIAHSNYVQTFSELGLTGFFFFLAPFYYVIQRMYCISISPDCGEEMLFVARSVLLGLVAISVSTVFVVMNYEIMYFLLGLGVACERIVMGGQASPFTRKDFFAVCGFMSLILFTYYLLSVHRVF